MLAKSATSFSKKQSFFINSIEGLYWAAVDASHAALMAAKKIPPSPEHIPIMLKEVFCDENKLKMRYIVMYRDLLVLHKKIMHGDVSNVKGKEIDEWQAKADEFVGEMARLVKEIVEKKD